MSSLKGTVNVVTPTTNSPTSAFNSYQVNFTGPQQQFPDEPWSSKPINGTLQRVINADGTWTETVNFTTRPRAISQFVAPAPSPSLWGSMVWGQSVWGQGGQFGVPQNPNFMFWTQPWPWPYFWGWRSGPF